MVGPGLGEVFPGHELEEGAIAGDRALEHGGAARGREAHAVALGYAGWERAEGRVEDALLRVVHDVRADGDVVAVEDHARQREAGAQSFAHVRDLLGDVGGKRAQAGDVGLVVARGRERHVAGQAREPRVETAVGVDGQPPLALLVVGDVVAQLSRQHVVADAILGLQARARDGLQAREHGPLACGGLLEIRRRHGGRRSS
jgi:hypothetical protein